MLLVTVIQASIDQQSLQTISSSSYISELQIKVYHIVYIKSKVKCENI